MCLSVTYHSVRCSHSRRVYDGKMTLKITEQFENYVKGHGLLSVSIARRYESPL